MNYKEASQVKMPFGKHCNKTLGEIAELEDGLNYLDWLMGINIDDTLQKAVSIILSGNNYPKVANSNKDWLKKAIAAKKRKEQEMT